MHPFHGRATARTLLALTLGLVVASCGSDPVDEEPEPEVATMRLTIGSQTYDVDDSGNLTGGPITIPVGSTSVSAQFLRADDTPEPLVTSDVFELRIEPADAAIADFTRGGAFNGTLVGIAAGSTTMDFALFHLDEQHEDFGPFPLSVTVQ
jgi:hypothetical protein